MSSIAFYPNTFSKDFSVTSPESVIEKIISGHWADQIQYLQSLNKAEYDAEKKSFLPSPGEVLLNPAHAPSKVLKATPSW